MTNDPARPVKIGLVQINNSFSGQNYLPYSIACLQSYVQKFARRPEPLPFLPMIYKRVPVAEIVEPLKDADVVGFSTYVWNAQISLEAARRLKAPTRQRDRLRRPAGARSPEASCARTRSSTSSCTTRASGPS